MSTGADYDDRVPLYLGRVLDNNGHPWGTCFEVEHGFFVTAWHVLNSIDGGDRGSVVSIDGLAGQPSFEATVVGVDPVHDLAVMQSEESLGAQIGGAFVD